MTTVKINGKDYQLNWVTGSVLEATKNMETKVSGGGSRGKDGFGNTRVDPIKSETTVHDQVFITDSAGQEHSYQLQNIDVACRQGNKLSIIWAIKSGQDRGPYVAVVNHSTSAKFVNAPALYKMYHPINETLLGILFIIVVILMLISQAFLLSFVSLILFIIFLFYVRSQTKGKVQKFKEDLQPDEFN